MITDGRKGGAPCGPEGHGAPLPARKLTKIRIHPKLNVEMVIEARRWGLELSRIVDEALVRETEAERRRRKVDRDLHREGGAGTGASTTET